MTIKPFTVMSTLYYGTTGNFFLSISIHHSSALEYANYSNPKSLQQLWPHFIVPDVLQLLFQSVESINFQRTKIHEFVSAAQ
jgi:hypothetical protein